MKRILIIASIIAATMQLNAQGVEINPMTRLQGSESGLYVSPLMNNINLSPDISLRGVSSVRSGGGPLWIVDGVILNNSHLSDLNPLSYLNPYDIQSVKVVKNISHSSVYGGKGAEGAIIINTASPEREGFNVNYHGNAGVTMPISGVDNSRIGCVTNHALSFTGHQGKT
jgi:iron complex outermembrane receptor protein